MSAFKTEPPLIYHMLCSFLPSTQHSLLGCPLREDLETGLQNHSSRSFLIKSDLLWDLIGASPSRILAPSL